MLVLLGQSQRWGNLLRKLVFIFSVFHDVGTHSFRLETHEVQNVSGEKTTHTWDLLHVEILRAQTSTLQRAF